VTTKQGSCVLLVIHPVLRPGRRYPSISQPQKSKMKDGRTVLTIVPEASADVSMLSETSRNAGLESEQGAWRIDTPAALRSTFSLLTAFVTASSGCKVLRFFEWPAGCSSYSTSLSESLCSMTGPL
jgi:hypothetical protein